MTLFPPDLIKCFPSEEHEAIMSETDGETEDLFLLHLGDQSDSSRYPGSGTDPSDGSGKHEGVTRTRRPSAAGKAKNRKQRTEILLSSHPHRDEKYI